jgi:hypothetical protein
MENAILVQADKRKTIIIINSEEYSKKVQTFLTDNNFHSLQKRPYRQVPTTDIENMTAMQTNYRQEKGKRVSFQNKI